MVKNLPTKQETQIQSLGQEDPLEKGIATHSSIPAWRIPQSEEFGGLQSDTTERPTLLLCQSKWAAVYQGLSPDEQGASWQFQLHGSDVKISFTAL